MFCCRDVTAPHSIQKIMFEFCDDALKHKCKNAVDWSLGIFIHELERQLQPKPTCDLSKKHCAGRKLIFSFLQFFSPQLYLSPRRKRFHNFFRFFCFRCSNSAGFLSFKGNKTVDKVEW